MKIMPERLRKAVQEMIFPSSGLQSLLTLPRTGYDYNKEVNGYQSAIIMACVNWILRTFPEAPIYLRQRNQDGSWDAHFEHEILTLLDTPNPYYDGLLLQGASVADYTIDGNAYWRKIRSRAGRVVQLWWIPSTIIEPKWGYNNTEYITHYQYSPAGYPENVEPTDIVHFRYGLDPDNIRKGLSPLKSLFREVFTDDEASNMTASLLKNLGVPGIIISPKEGTPGMTSEVGKEIKEWFKDTFTGDKRGEPLVMSGATKVDQFGFNPQQMDLKDLRRLPEERISGVLGVPAIVAGLGAGLARSTFANMQEAREMAYESNIIPSQRVFGSVIKRQLLNEFEDEITAWQVAYDLSEVRVLQEDENKKAERVKNMVLGGFLAVDDAQRETSTPVDETQHIYLRPLQVIEVPAQQVSGADRADEEEVLVEETSEVLALSGVQIEAAQSIIRNLIDGLLPPSVALELLVAVGLPRAAAQQMVTDSISFTPTVPQEEVIAGQNDGGKASPEATELKSSDLTEEIKAILWKRVDRQRVAWWRPASKQIEPLYEAESDAVAKAIKGKAPDKLVDIAGKAIEGRSPSWEKMLKTLMTAIIEDFGSDTAEDLGAEKSEKSIETKWTFDPTSAAIRKWIIEESTKDIVTILATNLDDVKRVILAGVDENLGTTQIGRNLRQFYTDRSRFKAMRVARTEVTKASSFGTQEAAKQSGVVQTKTWLSSRDDRVRDEHAAMDGETVKLDDTFSNGLDYPSEPMCRCVLTFGTGR